MSEAPSPWSDALLALALFAADPCGTGIALRAPAGPVRDLFLAALRAALPAGTAIRKMPAMIGDDALLGSLDLAATLGTGRKIAQPGFLAGAHGGVVLAAMAERLPPATASMIAAALDEGLCQARGDAAGATVPSQFGLVALDEGIEDEALTPILLDRLAFHLDLTPLSHHDCNAGPAPPAAALPPSHAAGTGQAASAVTVGDDILDALCTTAAALGAGFVRAPLLALHAARAAAAISGRDTATMEDAAIAARLVLAPRATRLSAEPDAAPPEPPPPAEPPPDQANAETDTTPPADAEILLAAAKAAIPPGLLARLTDAAGKLPKTTAPGRAGARQKGRRGRAIGVRAAPPAPGLRLNLVETLRAAAPWQRLRAREQPGQAAKIRIRRDDFRVARTEQHTRTTTIFLVDASGSSALNRLAEAKGAVELLLADCYKRRDQVAVLAFRGRDAKILLPPTRSLTRAKRSLSALPGGGGTPLAAGLTAGLLLADAVRRSGDTPTLVLLTDGRANVSLSGEGGRPQAEHDAALAARRLRLAGYKALFLDISPRPNEQARRLAKDMAALYLPLPYASASAVSAAVRAASGA